MPRSTRNARPITIDDRRLRWNVTDPSPPNLLGWFAQLTVFSDAGGTSRLLAGTTRDDSPYAPHIESWFRPRWVEAIIRRALTSGWIPEARAADYRVHCDYAEVIEDLERKLSAQFWKDRRDA
jgi:hypothetical protein